MILRVLSFLVWSVPSIFSPECLLEAWLTAWVYHLVHLVRSCFGHNYGLLSAAFRLPVLDVVCLELLIC